ncbi:MAG: HD domain-containing protein [Treponema sp.]|jgi:tRNA nucleotidyltransferase/poly(A) polymerase|nr:HD domain-containing protein [Treponema sp.]
MSNQLIHPLLQEIGSLFARNGKQVFLVGGAVRDMLLRRPCSDWDLATDARPEEVNAIFRGTRQRVNIIPTGIKHGTVTVIYRDASIEITTFRTESAYRDGRHPEEVRFSSSIEEDLSRRDFTMNALALGLPGGRLVDPFGGEADMRNRIIRCVRNPAERFAEDGLRALRAVRFAAQLGFEVEAATLAAIGGALDTTAKVSAERIRDELDKIISSPKPSAAFLLMEKTGLLPLILPELALCRGVEQKGYHRFDVLEHSLLACDYAARKKYPRETALAALFHDIGKVKTRKLGGDGVWTFYQHERESGVLAGDILFRLRYPGAVIEKTVHLIEEHMFHYTEDWTDAAVRRFIVRTGEEHLQDLYALRFCDTFGMAGVEPSPELLFPLARRVEKVLQKGRSLSVKDLAVSGKDLIAAGMKPGKHMGIILNELLETVLDDPEQNTREKLLEIADNLRKRYGSISS